MLDVNVAHQNQIESMNATYQQIAYLVRVGPIQDLVKDLGQMDRRVFTLALKCFISTGELKDGESLKSKVFKYLDSQTNNQVRQGQQAKTGGILHKIRSLIKGLGNLLGLRVSSSELTQLINNCIDLREINLNEQLKENITDEKKAKISVERNIIEQIKIEREIEHLKVQRNSLRNEQRLMSNLDRKIGEMSSQRTVRIKDVYQKLRTETEYQQIWKKFEPKMNSTKLFLSTLPLPSVYPNLKQLSWKAAYCMEQILDEDGAQIMELEKQITEKKEKEKKTHDEMLPLLIAYGFLRAPENWKELPFDELACEIDKLNPL